MFRLVQPTSKKQGSSELPGRLYDLEKQSGDIISRAPRDPTHWTTLQRYHGYRRAILASMRLTLPLNEVRARILLREGENFLPGLFDETAKEVERLWKKA